MVPQGSKIQSIISVAGHQVIRSLSEPLEFTLMHLDTKGEGIQNLRLDGLLTLIAITHDNLGGLMKLTRYPEQMIGDEKKFDIKNATDSWNKIRYPRHTLIQYLLQQNRFGTGEDETIEREEDVRRHVGACPY